MTRILPLLMLLIIGVALTSCESEPQQQYESIKLEASNIAFASADGGFLLQATVASEQQSITVTPITSSLEQPQISTMRINGQEIELPQISLAESGFDITRSLVSGDWGEIKYKQSRNILTIELNLSANDQPAPRIYDICLGRGYNYVVLEIVQLGNTTE